MKKVYTLLFFASSVLFYNAASSQVANHVVISQVYGGGGNTGAPYTNDFIELFNPTATAVNLTGWSVQYASATGTSWTTKVDLTGTIQPGKYYLIQQASGGTVGVALPTPDQTGTISMSATAGKVALVNSTTALTGNCPTGAVIVDFVGYGSTADCFEGTGPAPAPSNTNADIRTFSGCIDANNNSTDFTSAAPTPRNSASASSNCGTLPLTLTSFNASFNGSAAQLTWKSLNEVSVKGFSIERGIDGVTFTEIAFVNANNLAGENSYSYKDNSITSGANYYRIKTVGKDGTLKLSQVLVINNRAGIKASVFPNPVISSLTVNHTSAISGAKLSVLTLEGKLIKSLPVQQGAVQTSVAVSELIKGNYLLIYENNGAKTTTKFSKQ
jgi:predicted extracellular nuclease